MRNKLLFAFVFAFIQFSCSKDEEEEAEPIRDVQEQALADDIALQSYLESHFYNYEELNARLQNRGTDSDEEIERRLMVARSEMEQEKYYDYTIVSQSKSADLEAVLEIYKNEVARQR